MADSTIPPIPSDLIEADGPDLIDRPTRDLCPQVQFDVIRAQDEDVASGIGMIFG